MSDANAEGSPPKPPGTNVISSAAEHSGQTEQKGKGKRRKRRRTKRPKGIRPEQNDSLRTSEAGGADNNAEAGDASANGVFQSKSKSKRARRRKKGRGGDKADQAPPVSAEAAARNEQQPSGKRRRWRKRKSAVAARNEGQGAPAEQNGRKDNATAKPPRRRLDAYAALDLGTNNCRLLIAIPQQPGRFRVIDAYSRIVRLGEGLGSSGRLNDDAMDRAIEALKICSEKLANREVKNVRLIATEACRRAENGSKFLDRVREEAGLQLEIVDRETEARLAVMGCSSLVDRKAKGIVLFDIGGGSSELALLDLRKRRRHDLGPAIVSWTSLPLGVVTLSERHGGGQHVTREIFDDMVDDVLSHLDNFEGRNVLLEAAAEGEVHLLGTSGTVTTLAGIHLKLPRYDRRRVDGTWMGAGEVSAMIEELLDMTFEERVQNPCIGSERADLVLAGCAILVAIQKFWPCPRLRVADRGLREGLLTEMMNADNAWLRRPWRGARRRH